VLFRQSTVMKLYMFLMSMLNTVFGYKPVILIHGVLSEASHLEDMKEMIEESHPGTDVKMVALYPELESFVPLNHQLKYWKDKVEPLMNNTEGVHLICHSQGGLICQGLIESSNDHRVLTFIALSSPINGQFGVPAYVASYMPWLKGSRESLTKYMYTRFTQNTFAISNYWKDPRQEYNEEYINYAKYLPIIQNHPNSQNYDAIASKQRKNNFLKLKKLVLIGGPGDDVIQPWQSSLFSFYDSNYDMVHMKNQSVFLQDWFGLRTMFERGDVHSHIIPGVKHVQWHGDKNVFKKAIKPYLT